MSLVRPEDLGAALGVVDREVERERHAGGEDTAEVVAPGLAPDVTPHQHHARAEDELDVRAGRANGQEVVDRPERRREVGIEEADQAGARRSPARMPSRTASALPRSRAWTTSTAAGAAARRPSRIPGVRSTLPSSTSTSWTAGCVATNSRNARVEASRLVVAGDDQDEAERMGSGLGIGIRDSDEPDSP